MSDLKSKDLLYSFFIFDSVPPVGEGSAPKVYYYFCNDPLVKNDKIYQLNQIGYILAFMTFCKQFSTNLPLDYIFTKNHEYSLLELSGRVWMGVVLDSKKPENRALLNSILHHFRNMFSSFFCPLQLTENRSEVKIEEILKVIPVAFPSILKSVEWSRLDFRYLFNSYIKQPFKVNMEGICKEFLQNNSSIFDNIAIMYRRNRIIYSSFDPDTTRTLAFSIRRRFDHLFLHNPQRETEMLTWMIGLYINKSGFNSIYQQPVYLEGAPHLLVAFRLGYFKIVLTQPPDIEVTEEMLSSIPKRLIPIQQLLNIKNINYPQNTVPIPFAAARNYYGRHILTFNTYDLDAVSDSRLDRYFIKRHESTINFDRTATIAEPESGHSFIRCQRQMIEKIVGGRKVEQIVDGVKVERIVDGKKVHLMEEDLIFCKPPLSVKGISEKMKMLSYTKKPTENQSKTTNCTIT